VTKASAAIVAGLAGAAHAEPAEPTADELARHAAEEANLESNAPRVGLTLAIAAGGAVLIGADGGVGRGGALSLRVGQVATPRTIITFELTGSSAKHDVSAMAGVPPAKPINNDAVAAMVGGQYYAAPVFWLRASGGFGVYTKRTSDSITTYPGPAAGVGAGLDVYRRHYLAIGFEAFSIAQLARDGLHTSTALCLGLSYY